MSPAPSALINASEDDGSKSGREKAGDEGKEEAKAGSGGDADEEDVVEDEQKVAARELMLILLCNRSLAHLKYDTQPEFSSISRRSAECVSWHKSISTSVCSVL